MANYLDLLLAVDDFVRAAPSGCVSHGYEVYGIATAEGLVEWGDLSPANWTGQLVHLGCLTHGPLAAGDPHPLPPGTMWGERELQRVSDIHVTTTGRQEAERLRRRAREDETDVVLGRAMPRLFRSWMTPSQSQAVAVYVKALRLSLDEGRDQAAIGAAKNLVEAACKVSIEHSGGTPQRNESLVSLFKHAALAQTSDGADASGADLGRSLTATVQRIAELRNSVGAGHGHAFAPPDAERDARLAASAAIGLASFVLWCT